MSDCEHDWRVNPFVVLPSYPPQRQLVCAKCDAKKASGGVIDPAPWPLSYDPRTWPRA